MLHRLNTIFYSRYTISETSNDVNIIVRAKLKIFKLFKKIEKSRSKESIHVYFFVIYK